MAVCHAVWWLGCERHRALRVTNIDHKSRILPLRDPPARLTAIPEHGSTIIDLGNGLQSVRRDARCKPPRRGATARGIEVAGRARGGGSEAARGRDGARRLGARIPAHGLESVGAMVGR